MSRILLNIPQLPPVPLSNGAWDQVESMYKKVRLNINFVAVPAENIADRAIHE